MSSPPPITVLATRTVQSRLERRPDKCVCESILKVEHSAFWRIDFRATRGSESWLSGRILNSESAKPPRIQNTTRKCSRPRLFRADNRTAIHFVRHDQSDFGIGSGGGILDLFIRAKLMRSKPGVENDENLEP